MVPSTSQLMQDLLNMECPGLVREYDALINSLASNHKSFRSAFEQHTTRRAAYLIPQFLVESCYEALSNSSMESGLRKSCQPFSLICLSLAVGDDIVDSDHVTFEARMIHGCISIALMDYAYASVASNPNPSERCAISQRISSLMQSVTSTGAFEIQYRKARSFSIESYIEMTQMKTTCFTKHSLLLAADVLNTSDTHKALLLTLGERLGTAIQLLDDLFDVKQDLEETKHNLTYPEHLARNNQSMTPVVELATRALLEARNLSRELPHQSKLAVFLERAASMGLAGIIG